MNVFHRYSESSTELSFGLGLLSVMIAVGVLVAQ